MQVRESATLRQWTTRHYPHLSYNRVQQAIRNGDLRVNGKKEQPQKKLIPGDIITLWSQLAVRIPPEKASVHPSLLAKTKILAQNDDFWVIDKPYGIPSQRGTKANISIIEVMSHLMQANDDQIEEYDYEPHLVHRLDKHTTGVMIIATNSYAARDLSESLQAGDWDKTYVAEVDGIVETMEGTIDEPVFGKRSITEYWVLGYRDGHTILELKPITGRMHQLRQHCAKHLYPIVGDTKYDHWGKDSFSAEEGNEILSSNFKENNLDKQEKYFVDKASEENPNLFSEGSALENQFDSQDKKIASQEKIDSSPRKNENHIRAADDELFQVSLHPTFSNPGMRLRCAEIQFEFRGKDYLYRCY